MTTTKTLRDRAISMRETWLAEECGRVFRSNELASADEQRASSRALAANLRAELRTLRELPADVSDATVRATMGV